MFHFISCGYFFAGVQQAVGGLEVEPDAGLKVEPDADYGNNGCVSNLPNIKLLQCSSCISLLKLNLGLVKQSSSHFVLVMSKAYLSQEEGLDHNINLS